MGPRRLGRGNERKSAPECRPIELSGFNGATAFGPWKYNESRKPGTGEPFMLQWGHGV